MDSATLVPRCYAIWIIDRDWVHRMSGGFSQKDGIDSTRTCGARLLSRKNSLYLTWSRAFFVWPIMLNVQPLMLVTHGVCFLLPLKQLVNFMKATKSDQINSTIFQNLPLTFLFNFLWKSFLVFSKWIIRKFNYHEITIYCKHTN